METDNNTQMAEGHEPQAQLMEKEPSSEVEAFAGLIRNISEPIANSQVVVAQETTKQTEIIGLFLIY